MSQQAKPHAMGFQSHTHIQSVVIAGAGGFGLEVYDYLLQHHDAGGPPIAGFIDDTPELILGDDIHHPLLGSITDYRAVASQVVVLAIGSVKGRQAVLQRLWAQGVETPPFVADMAMVSPQATLGQGSIVCPFSIVGRRAHLGLGSLVNVHGSVGHGAHVGDFSVLSPYAALNGDATIGARCFLGTRATIYPKIHIGDDCIVDTHCGVRQNAPEGKVLIASRGNYQVTPLRTR